MQITEDILQEFKNRMRISHSSEDDNLKNLLSFSVADLTDKCGSFDLYNNKRAKELVFERTRYSYNDALEYFDQNFVSQINSLGFSLAIAEEGEEDAAV